MEVVSVRVDTGSVILMISNGRGDGVETLDVEGKLPVDDRGAGGVKIYD